MTALGRFAYKYKRDLIDGLHKFPEPVAQKLRQAIWYTNQDLQPNVALKYYLEAIQVAATYGMDPYSDEIIGVKIQIAALMEKAEQYKKAVEVLDLLRTDCLNWIDVKGNGEAAGRNRMLGWAVKISVKEGELLSNAYVGDVALAEERLVWAVETALKEQRRRDEEGVKEGEGPWLSNEELGGSLEELATQYEARNQHYLAAPLYLHALSLVPQGQCHSVVLMNNLATSLAQQSPPPTPGIPPPSQTSLISNARSWAQKSLALAASITPPFRTEECDIGCAVATHNLGEFLEMEGDIRGARVRYEEAGGLARAIGFREGVGNAEEGLRRLGRGRN
ncbi:hypothetical protein MMC09_005716 [Bachmanniomyces sp. S44760]|nr:hypothetical protein [Bachmanniomyces sp. S44760]